jgi:hypothetical protein
MPDAKQNSSKLAEMFARASSFNALVGMAVDVVSLFMALLSFVGIITPSLAAQGEQRRFPISTSTGTIPIEGAEWTVLLNVSRDTLRRFRIMVIEMHDLERLMDKHTFFIIRSTFERLLEDFYIVHNHPNNYGRSVRCGSFVIPRVLEMTLIRKDRVTSTEFAQMFPHPLDEKNDINGPDVPLPPQWFRQITR